jgi:hypothetical protein
VTRNYFSGIQVSYAHGFKLTGNVFTDNGQGGSDGLKGYTIEPGMTVLPSNLGTNYQVGDVVTLDPANGAGTPARAIVTSITSTGGIWPEGLMPVTMGNYTTWPTNPVNITGGHGTGAKCIFASSRIASGGSGYSVGQVLRHNQPSGSLYWNPVRIQVIRVDAGGAVTAYGILDGGGYLNTTYATLGFVNDAYGTNTGPNRGLPGVIIDPALGTGSGPSSGLDYPDAPLTGSGFTLSAMWGLRYSILYNSGAGTTSNVMLYHGIISGTISGNWIGHCPGGCGLLNAGSSGTDRATLLVVNSNAIIFNLHPLVGGTVSSGGTITLDANYNVSNSSIFDTVVTVGGTDYHSPLNKIA